MHKPALSSPSRGSRCAGGARVVDHLRWCVWLAITFLLGACGVNPVTGENELQLISEKQEIALGEKNYLFAQQSQGGDYTIDPKLTRYVAGVGQRLVKVSHRPQLPYEFVVLNNSVPNAWALPGGKIAINRGLLVELNNEAELAAVLGHEIVHAAARHGAQRVERGMLLDIGVQSIGLAAAKGRYAEHADWVVGAASVGAGLVASKYGRDAELESDQYGMRYLSKAGYDPRAAVSLQQTFVRLSKGRAPGWLEGLFASHPPSQQRVEENARFAQQLPPGGELGAARYQAHMAAVRQARPAYALYKEGREALAQQRPGQALALAEQAIAIEPREGFFYALQGDALLQQGQLRAAENKYTEALRRNQRFFYYYRQRGLAKHQRRDYAGARRDLQRSLTLLPTASAHHALGKIALRYNQPDQAIAHLRAAAHNNSAAGREAFSQLAYLELPRAPDKYIAVQARGIAQGYLVIAVKNHSPHAVAGIAVRVGVFDAQRRMALEDTVRIYERLGPGASKSARSAIKVGRLDARTTEVRTQVLGARIAE